MHPTQRHSSQSANIADHCHCSFGVATCGFCKYWDDYGARPTTKCGECFGLLPSLYERHHGLYDPHQTAKTVAKFLWQGYLSIFGSPAKILSNWGANFESNITKELWELMSIWKVRTSPYHAQTNGCVEQAHQMLIHMRGKLSREWKVDWPKYLPELVHAYDSTRSAIIGYSPHSLIFGCQLHLTINFYFPIMGGMGKHWHVNSFVAELHQWL